MSTPALKVVSNSPAAPPRRETLIAALERREELLTRYRTASAAVDRLRSLIEKETLSCSALAEIERKSAEFASAWARGDVATLEVSPEAEIDEARAILRHASRLADAARGAMASCVADAAAAAASHQHAVGEVTVAVHELLYVEAAQIRSRQLAAEAEAALAGEELISLLSSFVVHQLPDDRRGTAVAAYRHFINPFVDPLRARAEPRSMAPRPDLAQKYLDLATRLSRGDPAAALA